MHSAALTQLVLATLSCSQKELASRLSVSTTQISKWKKGEYMSDGMEGKLRAMIDIGDLDPEFVLLAGSLEAAKKWDTLIHFLAKEADESAGTGYNTDPLTDELSMLSWQTFDTLKNMGVDLPKVFPSELDIDYDEDVDDLWDRIHENPYSSLISRIYKSLTDVYGFYAAYVSDLVLDEELGLMETGAENIESCLLDLAASKLDAEEIHGLATRFPDFKHRITTEYEQWLKVVKDRAFRAGVPLRAELLKLVYESDEALGQEAERESLGLNSSRLHPDIYMDELLHGMRVVHQVLPAIMKKLGIETSN